MFDQKKFLISWCKSFGFEPDVFCVRLMWDIVLPVFAASQLARPDLVGKCLKKNLPGNYRFGYLTQNCK